MHYLMLFFTIIIISIIIAIKLKVKTEQAIPITVISLIVLVYLAGIFGNLEIGIYLILLITFFSLIYLIYYLVKYKNRRKSFLYKYFSPGIFIYGLMYILFIIINHNRIFENYDEFNHWGLIIKDMYMNNNFAFGRESATAFIEYPPFTGIFEYILLKFSSSYSEDTIIIANNILAVSIMMPIFKKVKWNKSIKWIFVITPIIVFVPMIIYEKFYFNILVDGLIGILIAYVLYQWFTNKNKTYRNISTGLGIIAITLIKSSGIGISLILILILLGEGITKIISKQYNKKDLFSILYIILVSILLLQIWNINIGKNNQDKNWNINNINIENIVETIKGNEPTGKEGFSNEFFNSIFTKNTITEKNLTILTTTILILAINLLVYSRLDENIKKKYKYYSISLYIFEILYIIYMLFVYLFLFNIEETNAFSSYERYFGTIALGMLLYHILIGLEYQKEINTKNIIIILSILISFLPVQVIKNEIINGKEEKIVAMTDRKTYIKILDYKDNLSAKDKIYYIDTTEGTSKYSLQIMKYQMIPIKIDNENIKNLTDKISVETLKKCGYTHIYIQKSSKELKEELESNAIDNLEDKTLYKINYEENIFKLEKVEN